jgi:hypothetical protein
MFWSNQPVAAFGTAMIAARLVTCLVMTFNRLLRMVNPVSTMFVNRSRSESVHSVARGT